MSALPAATAPLRVRVGSTDQIGQAALSIKSCREATEGAEPRFLIEGAEQRPQRRHE